MSRRSIAAVVSATVAGAVALAVAAAVLVREEPVDLLPDLDQAAPGELRGRTEQTPSGNRFFLGFESAAGNAGAGPLTLVAGRTARSQPELRLAQEIRRSDGGSRRVRLPVSLRYVRSATHSHWHLLDFMRYELRGPTGRPLRDRKTGFCLGDRYRLSARLAGAARTPRYRDECAKGKPEILALRVGISVGWGDDYKPHLEGQEFDVTRLPAGRYLLVHSVNPERVLVERDYGNNVASLAFMLSWPDGRDRAPRINVLERCPSSATCG
jgi:hypothetical protein